MGSVGRREAEGKRVVSRRLLNVEDRFKFQDSSCENGGGQNGSSRGFS